MRRILTIIMLLLAISTAIHAQRNEIYKPEIATLQVVAGERWLSMPIVRLNGDEVINISFDDLTHEYHRYTYTLEHCDADWSKSEELFASDYMAGFAEGNTIDDVTESLNTNVLYTHYSLSIPNRTCRIKMSGNYRLTVYDENDDNEKILTACFMVVEPVMGVMLDVSANTDIDIRHSHQQVSMDIGFGNLTVTDPISQVKTVVMQNMRWDNAVINSRPDYLIPNGMRWQHHKDYIFPAGNEYHKFEILDANHPTMGIDQITWDGENYHAWPFASEPRNNYIYDEDANGAFYIRNSENIENERQSEYVYVHYTLMCPSPVQGDVYINGVWTNDMFTPEYQMNYNHEKRCYEAVVLQKQGYYSYQYLMMDKDGTLKTMPTEGNFHQTENKYQALVYFRAAGDRSDRLVGYQEVQYRQ
ncbi:MAG: DUF5103 domain-containing protein [Prevotella sp.]|nr:DUF5103 domain-containing protein [Prevotella sp.]